MPSRNAPFILDSKIILQGSKLLFWLVLASLSRYSMAQEQLPVINKVGSAYDCTQVSLGAISEELLTADERIKLLDRSLTKSIDNYSTCIDNVQQQISNKSSGLGDSEQGTKGNAIELLAATTQQTVNTNKSKPQEMIFENTQTQTTRAIRSIFPPKDNDKVICQILFEEIAKTTEMSMLEGLKKQYANYKCG